LKNTLHKILSATAATSTKANWHFGGSFCSRRFTLWPWNRWFCV